MIYVAEISARVDAVGTLQTFLFATQGFATRPTDAPASTVARERLLQPANYSRALDVSAPFGVVNTGFGECVLLNPDGELDALLRYGVDGSQFRLLAKAETGGAYPADWTVCLVTSMDRVECREPGRVSIVLRDGVKSLLDKPVCTTFAGTGGLEGTAAMTGQPKPRVYGAPFNAPLTLLNGNDIYLMSDKPYTACFANFDGRYIIYNEAAGYDNVANYAALVAQSVSPGMAYRCGVDSVVKLGSVPAFPATFDGSRNVAGYASPWRTQVGEVVSDMAEDAGLSVGQIDGSVAAVSGVVSYFVRDTSTTYTQALDSVARSRGCFVGFDRLGVLQLQPWAAPLGIPACSFNQHNCRVESFRQQVPYGVIKANGARNWTPMSNADVANATKAASLEFATQLANSTMSTASAGSVPAKHPLATPFEFEYLGYNDNVVGNIIPSGIMASASVGGVEALIGVERDALQLAAPLSLALLTAVDLGAVVQVTLPRYGLSSGKLYRVAGIRYEFAMRKLIFTLWG